MRVTLARDTWYLSPDPDASDADMAGLVVRGLDRRQLQPLGLRHDGRRHDSRPAGTAGDCAAEISR